MKDNRSIYKQEYGKEVGENERMNGSGKDRIK